jgi:HEAT repeat protein
MEDFTELVKSVQAYDWGQSGAALLEIDAEIRKIAGHPEHLARLEQALLTILQSDASIAAKRGVCKRLGLIAGERSVPVLAAMLVRDETSDMARYSLERIASPAVDTSLREALSKTRGRTRVGVINSLGNRRDAKAVPALGELLGDADEQIAQAAAGALGKIGGAEAVRRLAARKNSAQGRVRLEILDAYLVCARRLASEGRKPDAVAIYKELSVDAMPAPVRRAASLGLKAASS